MRENRLLSLLLTAAMLAAAATFTACSGDKDGTSEKETDKPDSGEGIKLGEPIGLVYTDFLTETDVIHNADTTELRISKALADKKGITDFVNRPMGIWDQKEHRAYLRRATEQRLEGDRYVLKVVRSSVAEVTHGQEMALNTGIYYNPTRMARRTGLTRASGGNAEADKYIDDNNVIHPAAITVQMKSDAPAEARALTRASGDGNGNSATFTIEELYTNPPSGANGWFDWLEDLWDEIVEATSYDWNDDRTISLIHTSTTLKKNITIDCGDDAEDIIKLDFKCPIQFDLDYTLNIRSHGSIESAFLPIPSYLATYIEGYLEANPQLLIGFSKTISLPEDKQRITLFQFSGIGFTFMLGPVPLTIDIDPSVYLKFTADLKGNASLGVQYDIATKFKAGVKYDNGWSGIAEGEKVQDGFNFINPKASLKFTGSAGIYFGVDVIIEKVAGPSFNIGPQVGVEAELSYQVGDDHVKASIEGTAGIGGEAGAKIKIFGFEVAQWDTSFDIGPQWTIFKYPDDGSGSSGTYNPDSGGGGVFNPGEGEIAPQNIVLSPAEITLDIGERKFMGLIIEPSNATKEVVWSSSDNVVATVDQTGLVSALSPGTAIITATTINRGLTATCKVNVPYTVRISDYLSTVYVPLLKDGWSITGTQVDNNYRYDIADGATVTLNNVTIGTYEGSYHSADEDEYAGLNCLGDATIILKGTNSVTGRNRKFPGIHVPKGKTLTIRGDGSLIAKSFGNGAGIGGGNGIECGNIVIEGGTIVAEGGDGAAGIGSGANASCGNIVITRGVESVTATKGNGAPYSIGAGRGGSCGTVTIDGKTGAISQSPYTFSGVHATGVSLSQTTATIGVGETLRLTANVTPADASNKSVTWSSSNESVATVKDGVVTGKAVGMATITVTTVDRGKKATCTVTVYDDSDEYIVDLGMLTEDYTAFDGDILTGTLGKNVKISIANGATVTLRNVTINGVDNGAYRWAGINCRGNATIILEGTNSVRGFQGDYPGIHIAKGKTLTIKGSGTLNASAYGSGWGGAGIGGGNGIECGNIVIEGGTVNAWGGINAPGIGSGSFAACGNITITSGVTSVTATKGSGAPYSIGPGKSGSCGTVTIGGKVGAISESPYTYKP